MRRFPCRLYVVGGLDGSYRAVGTVDRFDPLTDSWESLPALSAPRAGPCAAVSAGRLYVLGGEFNGRALCDAQRFDPWLGRWEDLPSMTVGRIRAAAISCGGYLYVIGGLDGSRPLNSVERYDPLSRTWLTLPPMQRARYTCVAAAQGHCVYAFGGELADAGTIATVERFDPTVGQWELLSTTVKAPRCGAAVTIGLSGRSAFTMGGLGLSGQALGVADRVSFDLSLSAPLDGANAAAGEEEPLSWDALPPMNTPRHLATAATFRGGAVAVGGKGATFEATRDVELFDPDSWAWEVLPPLPSPRLRAAAVSGRL